MARKSLGMESSYSTIGTALGTYEYNCFCKKLSHQVAFSAFREDVVFLNVEVLESYLEDLLDLKTGDDALFIGRDCSRWSTKAFELSIVVFAVAMGSVSALFGASQTMAYCLTFLSLIPLLCIYYFSPRSTRRRMRFARVVSQEISRRRGHDKDGTARAGLSIGEFFIGNSNRGLHGAARVSTARIIVH